MRAFDYVYVMIREMVDGAEEGGKEESQPSCPNYPN